MKTCTIAECLEMEGMPIPRVTGTLKILWEVKSGKDWTVQSGLLEDGTGKLRVSFWNRSEVPAQGSRIVIRSVPSKKDGKPCGVHMDKDKSDKPCLSVKETALVCTKEDEPPEQAPAAAARPAYPAAGAGRPAPDASTGPRPSLAVRVTEMTEMLTLCYQAAQVVTAGDKEKAQPFASLMAIQLFREGYKPEKLPTVKPKPEEEPPEMDGPPTTEETLEYESKDAEF
jgi:hypothetical protein